MFDHEVTTITFGEWSNEKTKINAQQKKKKKAKQVGSS